MMGVGTSWPLLSLYNMWLYDGAWSQAGKARIATRFRRSRVKTVGDDLMGLCPTVVSEAYTRRLVSTGGCPSFGKDVSSKRRGMLAEELMEPGLVVLRPPRRVVMEPTLIPSVSVKLLCPEAGDVGKPPFARGPDLEPITKVLGTTGERIISHRYRTVLSKLRKFGVPPFLPREFGGAGFPSVKLANDAVHSLRPKWARALRCIMSQPIEGSLRASRLVGAWRDSHGYALPSWESDFWIAASREALESFPGMTQSEKEGKANPPRLLESQERLLQAVIAVKRMVRAPPKVRRVNLSLPGVSRKLSEAIDKLNRLVPYPRLTDPPRELRKGWELLREQLNRPISRLAECDMTTVLASSISGRRRRPPGEVIMFKG
jgi:hypothetical protein